MTNLLYCEPDEYIRQLANTFPDKVLVVSGCPGAALHGHYPRLRVLNGLAEMESFARGQ